jgi:putative ABC transport system permease protein
MVENKSVSPPALIRRVLLGSLPADCRSIVGDLDEEYRDLAVRGRRMLGLWYSWQAFRIVVAYMRDGLRRLLPGGDRSDRLTWPGQLGHDGRGAVRSLRRGPVFSATVIGTLGLAIGVVVSLVTVFDAILIRPLPYREPAQLYRVWEANPELGFLQDGPSQGNFLDWRRESGVFDGLAAWWAETAVYVSEGDALQATVAHVSGDLFELLGAEPQLGRWLRPEDAAGAWYDNAGNHFGADRVVVISDGFWREKLGRDPEVIGRRLEINRAAWTVVGVMPPSFAIPRADIDLWNSWDLTARPAAEGRPVSRDTRFLGVVGRLADGQERDSATARLDALAASLAERHPATNRGWEIRITPLSDDVVGTVRAPLRLLLAAVGLMLLAACANVSGLLLARGLARQPEIGLRMALGASRWRVSSQLLFENMLLALVAGLLGTGIAFAAVRLIAAAQPMSLPRVDELAVDLRVLIAALAITTLCGLLAGTLPAWAGARSDVAAGSRGTRGTAGSRGGTRLRQFFVVAQVSIAVVLLTVAGVLVRSLVGLFGVDPGWATSGVVVARVPLESGLASSANARMEFFDQLQRQLATVPQVDAVGAVTALPMSDIGADFDRPYWRADQPDPGAAAPEAWLRMSTPGYFAAMGRPLVSGRDFLATERFDLDDTSWRDAERVAIISAALARGLWPDSDPVGQQLSLNFPRQVYPYRVVGVVEDARHHDLRDAAQPEIFLPYFQNPYPALNVAIRTTRSVEQMRPDILAAVREINPAQPVHSIVGIDELVAGSVARERFLVWLLAGFAAAALALSAIGIYGLVAYWVGSRTREIGVRVALGASRADVVRTVLNEGISLTVVGLLVGSAVALFAAGALGAMVYETPTRDPLVLTAVAAVTFLAALAACWVPTWRALRLDPTTALRAGGAR